MNLINFLALGAIVFTIGAYGVLTRRNLILIFMCLELMFGGVGISLVALTQFQTPTEPVGQIFVIFMLTVAAAETALGLGIFLATYRTHHSISSDEISDLKG